MTITKLSSLFKNKIYKRLVLALACLVLFLLIIFISLFNETKENILSIGNLNCVQVAQEIQYYLIEEIDEISLASYTVEAMQQSNKSNEEILDYLSFESKIVTETINENYTGLYGYINCQYLDGSGWVPEEDYNPTSRPWYISALSGNGNVVYVTPYVDSETGTLMISICKMLSDGVSVVSLDVSLTRIQSIIDNESFSKYDQLIIADKDNIIVSSFDNSLIGKDFSNDPLFATYNKNKSKINNNGFFEYRDANNDKYSVFTSSVENQWNIFLIIKSNQLMSSIRYIYLILAAVALAFIVFVLLIFDYVNKRRKAAEVLNIQLESIADIYISAHKIDLINDTFTEIKCLPYVRNQINIIKQDTNNTQEILKKVMKALTNDDYWEDVKAFIDFNTLDLRAGNSSSLSMEFLGIHGWVKARILVLEREKNKIASFLWLIENIDEEKRKQSELKYLSETDLMTGIRNRGSGERLIKECLMNNTTGMFCIMDADHFKEINDNYGHDVGDAAIKAIAECLRKTFRTSDIIMRLGGDEFAVYALGIENKEVAEIVLNRFINAINKVEIDEFKDERKVEISIGVSFVTTDNIKNFDVLYKEADHAVYQSKNTEGCFITYHI